MYAQILSIEVMFLYVRTSLSFSYPNEIIMPFCSLLFSLNDVSNDNSPRGAIQPLSLFLIAG